MTVWSRGLGRHPLNLDFAKCDVIREGNEVVIKGILRNSGIIWDCRVTFTREDVPGLVRFVLSSAMRRHFARNIKGSITFVYHRFVRRRMGLKSSGTS